MSIIKSFSVDKGDTFYHKHESSNFTVIDCNIVDERKDDILQEIAKNQEGRTYSESSQRTLTKTTSMV